MMRGAWWKRDATIAFRASDDGTMTAGAKRPDRIYLQRLPKGLLADGEHPLGRINACVVDEHVYLRTGLGEPPRARLDAPAIGDVEPLEADIEVFSASLAVRITRRLFFASWLQALKPMPRFPPVTSAVVVRVVSFRVRVR